ncbi:MAG: RNA methyltransferase [Anaerolineae bacterium]|nr:RNA methyltransferase [Anaerolineae bacterium]
MSGKGYLYYAHTMPGLEEVAWIEMRSRLDGASFEGSKTLPGKNGLVFFRYAGQAADLLKLRAVEDVFFLVVRIPKVAWGREGLSQIYQLLARDRFLEAGLGLHGQVSRRRSGRGGTFRVISRMAGGRQPYRRIDFERAAEGALKKRLGRQWRAVEEGEDVEIWANLIGLEFVCGLRLSDASMRHREYKQAHVAASLRPSVAAAMAWLTDPRPGDVFLDPLCGAGTLLVERGTIERHALLLGGDIDAGALRAAAQNVGPRHKPRQLLRWDAGRLPLADASVDKIATNLPFGKQIGSPQGNRRLYRAVFAEIDRVLCSDGSAVVLSSEAELIKDTVRKLRGLQILRGYSITVLGQQARVYVIGRSG